MSTTGASDSQQQPQQQPDSQTEIVAKAGSYYRNMRYLIMVGLIATGCWFGYDGFVKWPAQNQQVREMKAQQAEALRTGDRIKSNEIGERLKAINNGEEHSSLDLTIQKVLAFSLPPLSLLVLAWTLYNSRGMYRLSGQTLEIPGHPSIPFENITEVDTHLWDRKGIAYVSYDLGDGRQGKARLDDFVYDREPTDMIYERIEKFIKEEPGESAAPEQSNA